jgi:hypothetical protein
MELTLLPPISIVPPSIIPIAEMAVVAGLFACFVLTPPVRRAILAPTKSDDTNPGVWPMGRVGMFAAYIPITLIIGGSVFDMLRDTEHWPWSNFPMYSQIEEKGTTFEDYRLYGVLKSNPTAEFSLSTDSRYTQPFDPSRLAEALSLLADDPRLHEGLQDRLRRYEILRQSGAHNGPAISGLRLYRVGFVLKADAANSENPEEKILIDEVSSPISGGTR